MIRLMIALVICSIPLQAITISDTPKNEVNTPIYRIVEQGYLSLFDDKSFKGDQAITRQEMAVIIDKLLSEMDGSGSSLSKAELQELATLSKTFKSYISDQSIQNTDTGKSLKELTTEQTVIQHDLTEAYGKFETLNKQSEELIKSNHNFHDDYRQFKQSTHDQQVYTWAGIGLAALLGILL